MRGGIPIALITDHQIVGLNTLAGSASLFAPEPLLIARLAPVKASAYLLGAPICTEAGCSESP